MSTVIFGTHRLSNNLRQYHVIVGKYKWKGYPITALLVPENRFTATIIAEFLRSTVDLGYPYAYITTDMNGRNKVELKLYIITVFNYVYGILKKTISSKPIWECRSDGPYTAL